ncbi:MAG TPA: DUF3300 domain-containing protein [Candidatus Angelobacter sp.]|nr:DUF3300 domain-containing protein [Candidatus Angelobacter sp.]
MGSIARNCKLKAALLVVALCCVASAPLLAQEGPPPSYPPGELDQMVSRIALYPDPLLAQILAAATYPDQIQDAAGWSDQHHYLTGDALAQAIQADQLPWDPSVQALLPFPSVLDMMARDMNWTSAVGNAFLAQQQDVMDAVQRMRHRAWEYGYLRTGPQVVVSGGPYITILPARPDYVVVPYYDPAVVYVTPRPGFFAGAAIGFRFGVFLGPVYRPWGWGYNRFAWNTHAVFINNARWDRRWANRAVYVHPYTVRRETVVRGPEWRDHDHHELYGRSERERSAASFGHERVEEHRAVRHEERHEDRGRHEGKDRGDRGHDRN